MARALFLGPFVRRATFARFFFVSAARRAYFYIYTERGDTADLA